MFTGLSFSAQSISPDNIIDFSSKFDEEALDEGHQFPDFELPDLPQQGSVWMLDFRYLKHENNTYSLIED